MDLDNTHTTYINVLAIVHHDLSNIRPDMYVWSRHN
jgi:hypothetical protein